LFLTASERVPSESANPQLRQPSQFWGEYPNDFTVCDIKRPDPTRRIKLPLERAEPLRGFPTSYSELRYYDWCPYNYQLRNIYGFNPKLDMALGYGKSVHNILNLLHTRFRDNPPTEEEVLDVIDENFYLRYASPETAERFKKAAERLVTVYVDKFCGDFHRVLETEKSFEFILGEALISGAIDLIKTLDDKGKVQGIEIVDFKNRDAGEFTEDHEKQLKLYAIASLRALDLNPKKAVVHHLDDNSLNEVDVSPSALKKTEEEVAKMVLKIINRQFPKTTDKGKCRKCDFQHLCSKR
jgi:DNA helicase-2/ATP-dependent DNA helicase PcrA